MYQIGSVVAIPFIGPAIDTWGRRAGMWIAAVIIFLGVVIQGTCVNTASVGQFMGGRFLLGFGVGIIGSAGPCYVVEISHPAHRGVVTGLYNVFWPVGALVASGAARGGLDYGGNTSWLLPVWMQAMFPSIIIIFAWFLPESPRWLYVHGKREQAVNTLTRYHGNGNPNSEWVKLQMMEYESHLEMDGADKRWWDYRALFKNRASRYRLLVNCMISLFGQWAGNGIVSYFLSAFLDTAGIHGDITQTNVQLGMNAVQIVFASIGATTVDKFGRRPILIWVNIICGLCWVGITVSTSIANLGDNSTQEEQDNVNPNVSRAVLAWVYIFQIFYSFGWTPMQALYPVEVLSFEMRAKGMAFSNLFVSIGLLVNQFGVPVALKNIAWRTYIVFLIWCFIQAGLIYLFVPETKNRTVSSPIPLSPTGQTWIADTAPARGTRRDLQGQESRQGIG
jgi:sugar porter (SP) family MFS transporter